MEFFFLSYVKIPCTELVIIYVREVTTEAVTWLIRVTKKWLWAQPSSSKRWPSMKLTWRVQGRKDATPVSRLPVVVWWHKPINWGGRGQCSLLPTAKPQPDVPRKSGQNRGSTAKELATGKFVFSFFWKYTPFRKVRMVKKWLNKQHFLTIVSRLSRSISCFFHWHILKGP